ncbi:MAG TPA: hypothetical protein VFJ09_10635 [Nocardioidaceae bacterium]|nr:hypothetical protein [Nocardioidaceae bacterium]
MSRPGSALLLALAVLLPVLAAPAAGAQRGPESRVLCRLHNPRIIESSGLVDHGQLLFTTNDSGDGPYLYGVTKAGCRTAVITTYASESPTDVEALAPGPHGSVWVGDIGDNQARRSSIAVYHVRERGLPRQVDAPRYTLVYPDGPHDAETLLASPDSGRLYVVTKALLGGAVYAAPARLSAAHANRLRKVAEVSGLVTDGAFLPDGQHVLLRTYGTVTLFSFPGFRPLGTARLPQQRQGEGLAVSPSGQLYLSSEGIEAPVLEVALPDALARRADVPAADQLGPRPTPPPAAVMRHRPAPDDVGWLIWTAVGVLALAVAVWAVLTFALPRSRRTR